MNLTPPLSLSNSGLKLICNVNIVYGNIKCENSQDYSQKPQRNCTFMNSASAVTSCQSHLKTVTDTRVLQQSHLVTATILQESYLVRVTMLQQSHLAKAIM